MGNDVREEERRFWLQGFGCLSYVLRNKDRQGDGKHLPRAVKARNIGFASDRNMSSYKFFVLETKKLMISNEAQFDDLVFSY